MVFFCGWRGAIASERPALNVNWLYQQDSPTSIDEAYGKRQESIKIYVGPRRYVRVRDGGVSRYGSSRLKTIYSQSLALGESTLEVIVSSSLVWYSGSRRIVEPRMTPLRL